MFAFEIKFSSQEQWNKSRWKLNSVKRRKEKKFKLVNRAFIELWTFFPFFYLHAKNFIFPFSQLRESFFLPQMRVFYQSKEMKNYQKVSHGNIYFSNTFCFILWGKFLNLFKFLCIYNAIRENCDKNWVKELDFVVDVSRVAGVAWNKRTFMLGNQNFRQCLKVPLGFCQQFFLFIPNVFPSNWLFYLRNLHQKQVTNPESKWSRYKR